MSNLSEKDLALLSTLIYSDFVIEEMHEGNFNTLGEIVTYMLENPNCWEGTRFSGDYAFLNGNSPGTGYAQFVEILELVASSGIQDLQLQHSVIRSPGEPAGITAAAFSDRYGSEVAVFRGTDGSAANWNENVQKARPGIDAETRQQTLEFMAELELRGLTNVVTTGHSKGGNLAKYATLFSSIASVAYAFGAPGFNDSFIREHRDLIEANRDHITRIDSHGDFVPALLNCIAGRRIFVENEGDGFKPQHVLSNTILYSNAFDADGNFIAEREQGTTVRRVGNIANGLLTALPPGMEDAFLDFVGPLAGLLLGGDDMGRDDVLRALPSIVTGVAFVGLAIAAPKVVMTLVVAAVAAVAIYAVVRFADWAIGHIASFVGEALDVIAGAVESFGNWAVDFVNGIRDSFREWRENRRESRGQNSGGSTGDFILNFDQIDSASRNFRSISGSLGDSSSSLRAVASLLAGQSGFGIPGIQRTINDLARDLERLEDDVNSIAQFTTTLSEMTQRYENMAHAALTM